MNKRKPRSDRTHIVYQLTVLGLTYVGVTARTGRTVQLSVAARVAKHWYRAQTENRAWLLCQALRHLTTRDQIGIEILATVRGRAQGHDLEVSLRRQLAPALNTDCRGD